MLLAPTINLMRTPLGGRGFECFSEDPVLTARMAAAFITGLQSAGVAATVKHFVGNDSETERWTYDVIVSEQVLRELYMAPFEACVTEAGAALVMAAYNRVNGTPATEHPWLLRQILKGEWEFGGVVVSDWSAARTTVATAVAGLDLAMPGPKGPWGADLVQAVLDGVVPESVIDDKVVRILRLARWAGALTAPGAQDAPPVTGGGQPVMAARRRTGTAARSLTAAPGSRRRPVLDGGPDLGGSPVPDGGPSPAGDRALLMDPQLVRRVTAASFVLLRNEGQVLPFDPGRVGSIALIGPNAVYPVIQGGGSAIVAPVTVSTPAAALPAALAGQASVTVAPGCRTWTTVPEPVAGSLRDPADRRAGAAAGVPRRRRDADPPRAPDLHPAHVVGRGPAGRRGLGRERDHHAAHPVPGRRHRAAPDRRGRRRPSHADRGRRGGRRHGHPRSGRPGADHDPSR